MSTASYWVVVPAAGYGQRMGADLPKQYLPLGGKPVMRWTVEALLAHPRVAGVILSVAADDARWRDCVPADAGDRVRTVTGGAQRAESVEAGLNALKGTVTDDAWVLVHDAVRPCVHPSDVERLIAGLEDDPVGGLLAAASADTIKQIDDEQRVAATLDRRQVWRAMTPQMFRYGTLCRAYAHAREADRVPTDESTAVEALGLKPKLIVGRADNVKITQPEDLGLAEAVLRARGAL